MSSIGQIPCQCPLTSCHFSLTPYRTYKQAAKQQETTSHSTTSISLLSFSFFFTAPSISLPARVSCSPDMASFRSSGAPNLLPLCCGSRASPYNHHSLTFSARSYFPTAVCSLLSHSLSPSSLPPTLSFGCSHSCYLHLLRERSKRVKKTIMFLRRKQLLSDWPDGPKEASATAMAAGIKIGLALPCCCRKRKKRRARERVRAREYLFFKAGRRGGREYFLLCSWSERGRHAQHSHSGGVSTQTPAHLDTFKTASGLQHTQEDYSQHLYRIQFNTECYEWES